MYFEIIGEIEGIEPIAIGSSFGILRGYGNATGLVVGEN
jgi:hypothetical protein